MNTEEDIDIIKRLQAEKSSLEVQIKRVRADYNALNSIQTSVNNSLRESNAEILELQAELILKNHEIAALSSIPDNISFFQLLWTNYNFIQCKPLPLKLAIGVIIMLS